MRATLMTLFCALSWFCAPLRAENSPPPVKIAPKLEARDHTPGGPATAPKGKDGGTPATATPLRLNEHIVYDIAEECLKRVREMPAE